MSTRLLATRGRRSWSAITREIRVEPLGRLADPATRCHGCGCSPLELHTEAARARCTAFSARHSARAFAAPAGNDVLAAHVDSREQRPPGSHATSSQGDSQRRVSHSVASIRDQDLLRRASRRVVRYQQHSAGGELEHVLAGAGRRGSTAVDPDRASPSRSGRHRASSPRREHGLPWHRPGG